MIQLRIAKLEGWLRFTRRLHLAQEMSDVIGSEGAGCQGFFQGSGDLLRPVSAGEIQELVQLTKQRMAGIGQAAQVSFDRFFWAGSAQELDQPLLGLGTPGGGAMGQQFFLEALGPESLATPPGACITDDFSSFQIIEGDRRRIRLDDQALSDQAGRGAVTVRV